LVLAIGLAFFAWRNWYFSGVFSVFPYRAALSRLVDGDGLVES